MARPREPERREAVLDLVIAHIADHGLPHLTVRKVAAAIGTSTRVIFYQFGSKEGLLQAALDRARKANRDMLEDLREENPSISMAEAFRLIWHWWMNDPSRLAYSRLNMEAMMTQHGLESQARAELLGYWIDYFTEWLVSDGHEAVAARVLAGMSLAMQSGLTIDLIITGDRRRLDEAVEVFSKSLEVVHDRR